MLFRHAAIVSPPLLMLPLIATLYLPPLMPRHYMLYGAASAAIYAAMPITPPLRHYYADLRHCRYMAFARAMPPLIYAHSDKQRYASTHIDNTR